MNESLPSPYRRALRMLDTPDAKALLGAPPLEALQNGDGAAARRSLDATRRWTRYQLWVLMVGAMALGVWVGLMYDAVSLRGWEG
ncbi:hypothetical protein, partial [Salisaeta longa]|uniref:hypothetical protein n=1 Tax=Salisaeta longa TaxID=503170 RepID=UPI0012F7EE15